VKAIIQLNQLARRYGDALAVKGLTFDILEGEIFSLLGPNGAGKTTTISMLSTILSPTSGDAVIDGHSIRTRSDAVRNVIGIVPQEIALYDDLTAAENLGFWGRMYGLSGATLRERVGEALDQIGLTKKADQRVGAFSGGMKRRVNIAAGLLHRPRVLILDEPTVGVDPQSRRAILDWVKALNRQGMTVLYTTHYMEEAEELSNRIGIIDHGELIALGTLEELIRKVGQRETLRLNFGEDANLAGLAEALRGLDGVLHVDAVDHHLAVTVPGAEGAIVPVISRAMQLGARVKGLDVQAANLEAVFLHLTGRALRD